MTPEEAFEAYLHAEDIIRGCKDADELDAKSDWTDVQAEAPHSFTPEQVNFVSKLMVHAYERSIGRA